MPSIKQSTALLINNKSNEGAHYEHDRIKQYKYDAAKT